MNCSSDLKNFEKSWPSALNFKSISRSQEQFLLIVSQNNFDNKIPFLQDAFSYIVEHEDKLVTYNVTIVSMYSVFRYWKNYLQILWQKASP